MIMFIYGNILASSSTLEQILSRLRTLNASISAGQRVANNAPAVTSLTLSRIFSPELEARNAVPIRFAVGSTVEVGTGNGLQALGAPPGDRARREMPEFSMKSTEKR
jgi:hypothetical protein